MVFTRPSTPLAVPAIGPPLILPLYQGDCEQVLATLPENSFDAVVTDPPYGINFMGRAWDHGVPSAAVWKQVLRVMKPGAHLLSFAGTRTYHRMAVAVEDAGFEIRNMFAWLYAQGWPKGKEALKPAMEPCVIARKPCSEPSTEANRQRWGLPFMNIDECRIENADAGKQDRSDEPAVADRGDGVTSFAHRGGPRGGSVAGRWPANVGTDGSDTILAVLPDAPGQLADASPDAPSSRTGNIYGKMARGGESATGRTKREETSKSAARFWFCAKATKADRCGSKHPTVKPVALIRYLCRLVTPPGGRVLDPFAGSGTLYEAAILEGFVPTLIEREAEYIIDIQRRMERCAAVICG